MNQVTVRWYGERYYCYLLDPLGNVWRYERGSEAIRGRATFEGWRFLKELGEHSLANGK